MFPKGDHLSFGVGGPANLARHMMPYLQQFLDTVVPSHSDGADYNIRSLKSWPIPVKRKKGEFHNGRILVAGDAAGLTDALTGEGIYYAVRSGKLAAKACSGYLQGSYTGLESYSEAVNRELMTELLEAVRIRDVFNAVPRTIHRLVRENDRVWRAFGKILRGERHYADVRGGFGKFRFLWRTATFLSYLCYRTKETIWTRRSSSPVQAGALGAPLPASSIPKAGR